MGSEMCIRDRLYIGMSYVFDSLSENEGLPKNAYLLQPTLKTDELPAVLEISTLKLP